MLESDQKNLNDNLKQNFVALEKKIAKAIEIIRILKDEKAELTRKLSESIEEYHKLNSEMESLQEKFMEAEKWQMQVQDLTQTKKWVTEKVENLLDLITNLEIPNP